MPKGFPQSQLDSVPANKKNEIIKSLRQLYNMGRPESDAELAQRIDTYFLFCETSNVRPGIESLCLSLHISRTTLFNWCRGINCTVNCQEIVQAARMFVSSYIEQCMLSGQVNPASAIFLMKNWCNYKDSISLEDNTPKEDARHFLSSDKLPVLGEPRADKLSSGEMLPKLLKENMEDK